MHRGVRELTKEHGAAWGMQDGIRTFWTAISMSLSLEYELDVSDRPRALRAADDEADADHGDCVVDKLRAAQLRRATCKWQSNEAGDRQLDVSQLALRFGN